MIIDFLKRYLDKFFETDSHSIVHAVLKLTV